MMKRACIVYIAHTDANTQLRSYVCVCVFVHSSLYCCFHCPCTQHISLTTNVFSYSPRTKATTTQQHTATAAHTNLTVFCHVSASITLYSLSLSLNSYFSETKDFFHIQTKNKSEPIKVKIMPYFIERLKCQWHEIESIKRCKTIQKNKLKINEHSLINVWTMLNCNVNLEAISTLNVGEDFLQQR